MTKAQTIYAEINSSARYTSIRWIANVIFTSCGKPASRLASLKKLVDAGREIRSAQFIMPYEALVVDGATVVALALLDRGEQIAYGPDWYKH